MEAGDGGVEKRETKHFVRTVARNVTAAVSKSYHATLGPHSFVTHVQSKSYTTVNTLVAKNWSNPERVIVPKIAKRASPVVEVPRVFLATEMVRRTELYYCT